ncbi:BTB/POZ domain-containing protein [Toxoplasma gondii GAB2-2007-GAL-DOM2]|uniref:BTB/POZ domain-containing protein n=1 Tax=Toxoplasma gondii GAB2-2007-GAL-DOM2 TaxID=1130820 RepID=A0A086KH50_TOXGO|nr:BTB/POZ domain-containing protein [Toxoplasma gondii GAB2-2007-GAL-DOM2]
MARRLPLVSGHASSQQSHRHSNRTSSSSRRGRSHQTRSSPHSSHSTHSASHSSHASPSHSSSSHSSFRAQQGESRGSSRRGHHRSSRHPSSEATTPALSSSSSSSSSVSSTSSAAASTSASGSTNTGSTGRTGRVSSMGEGRRPSTASSVAALSDLSACSGQSTTRNATQKPAKKDSKLLPFTPVYRQFNLASHVDKRRVCANWRVTHFPEIWALAKNRFLRAQDEDQYIDSPLFGDAEVGFWFLRLYPYGDSKNAGSLELYLMVDSNLTEDVLVHYKLQIFKQSPSGFPASQTQTKRDFIVQYEDSDVYSKNEPGVGYGPTHLCDVSTRRKARALTWSDGSLKIRALLDCPILEALVGPQSSTSSAARPRPLVALRHLSCKSEGFEKKGKTHALQRRTATTLSEEVAAFIEHEKDMEIEFRGETFPANKLILVSRSKVFRAMLKGLFQEGLKDSAALSPFLPRLSGQKRARTESSETRNVSKLNLSETAGLTVSALKNLLLYMHTDTCPLLSAENEEQKEEKSTQQKEVETINSLLELLVAADLYDVQVRDEQRRSFRHLCYD